MNFISKPTWPFAPVIKPFQSQSAARLFAALQIIVTLCSLIFLLFGCGFAGTPPGDRTVVVTIDPTAVTLAVGQTQQFQAAVKHSTNSAVTWTVNNISGGNTSIGTISSAGLYTAPSGLPNPASVTVTATSQAAPQSSASATVAITDSIQVNVSPK